MHDIQKCAEAEYRERELDEDAKAAKEGAGVVTLSAAGGRVRHPRKLTDRMAEELQWTSKGAEQFSVALIRIVAAKGGGLAFNNGRGFGFRREAGGLPCSATTSSILHTPDDENLHSIGKNAV